MKETKLITLIQKLGPEEFKELEKFVASPYFARGRDFVPLFKILKTFYPEFNDKKLTKEFLFKKIYPDEKYNPSVSDNKLKILFSGMYKLCLDFLVQIELNIDTDRKDYYLLKQLNVKKLDNEFERMSGILIPDEESILKGTVFDHISKYFRCAVMKSFAVEKDNYKNVFETSRMMREHLITAFLIECLRYESEKTVMSSYNLEKEGTLTDNIIENINMEKFLEDVKASNNSFYPQILVYYTLYLMEKFKDEEKYFFELKKLLIENKNILGRIEKYALWISLATYCTYKKRHQWNSTFDEESFEVHNEMLNQNVYKTSEVANFNIVMFRNMVLAASSLKQNKWLKNFIDKYSCELHSEHREDMKYYSLAYLYFTEKKFEQALENAMKVKFELFLYKMDMKILLMKIYYELQYFEQIYSVADATLHFLKSTDKHPETVKVKYKNFIKYLKELIKFRYNGYDKNADLKFFKINVMNEKLLNSIEWVIEKIEELEKSD